MQQNPEALQLFSLVQENAYVCHTLLKDPDAPSWIIGFHAQQAVENSLIGHVQKREFVMSTTQLMQEYLQLTRT